MKKFLLMFVAVALLLSGCGTTEEVKAEETAATAETPEVVATEAVFDLEAYKEAASELKNMIAEAEPWTAGVVGYNLRYAENSRKISGSVNYEAMHEAAVDYSKEHDVDWDLMAERADNIKKAYLDFMDLETGDNPRAQSISENMKDACESYLECYKFALSPSANGEATIKDTLKRYLSAMDNLDLYLSE